MTRKIQQLSDSGARVSYLEEGDGLPLVLIHGVGMNADTWFLQTEQLSRYFRVIAVDMPGHGQSTGFSHPATLKDYVEWLASFLQARKEQRFAIAGHSMGALITAGIAIDYPQLVSHAVVISGVYKRDEAARKAVLQRAKELAQGDVRLDAPLERWFDDSAADSPLRNRVGTWLQQVDRHGYARAYQAFATGDRVYSDRWNEMDCPVLVMTGEKDSNSNPQMTAAMADAARSGKAVIVENARHMLNLTDGVRVNQEILAFLSPDTAIVSPPEPVKE